MILRPIYLALKHVFKRRFTIKYPYVMLKPSERTIGRHILYAGKCAACRLCVKFCPTEAIEIVEVEGRNLPQIDYGRCCFCELCVHYCPARALAITSEYEIAAFDKRELVYSPQALSTPPDVTKGRKVLVPTIYKRLGVSHVKAS